MIKRIKKVKIFKMIKTVKITKRNNNKIKLIQRILVIKIFVQKLMIYVVNQINFRKKLITKYKIQTKTLINTIRVTQIN